MNRKGDPDVAEVIKEAASQAMEYQRRLANQREIIERYDRFRRWVLGEVVDEMTAWSDELLTVDQREASRRVLEMVNTIVERGTTPQ